MTDNPFTNAKVVSDSTSLDVYLSQPEGVKRGDPRFVMRSGELRAFLANPQKWLIAGEDAAEAEAEAEDETPKPATKSQLWGSLVDCLLTMPQDLEKRYCLAPTNYTNSKGVSAPWTRKSPTCRDWEDAKRADGFEVVTPELLNEAKLAASRMAGDPEIGKLVAGAKFQVMATAEYQDDATGLVIVCKVLIDVVPDLAGPYRDCIADLKTCRDGSYEKWQKAVEEHGYDIQAALQLDIVQAAGEQRTRYLHPIQENKAPYVIGRRDDSGRVPAHWPGEVSSRISAILPVPQGWRVPWLR